MTGNIKHKFAFAGEDAGGGGRCSGGPQGRREQISLLVGSELAEAEVARLEHSVFKVNFMVKLLRACVWMPWRKQAKKDVASYDKPRGVASTL